MSVIEHLEALRRALIISLLAWGVADISATIGALNGRLAEALAPMGFRAWPERWRAPHYLCLTSDTLAASTLARALTARQTYVSVRGNAIRITPHLYNSAEDVGRFIEAVGQVVRP